MDNDLLGHIIEIKGCLGELKAGQESNLAYVKSVSAKTDALRDDFEEHESDEEAHGAKASRKVWGKVLAILGALCGVAGAVAAYLR